MIVRSVLFVLLVLGLTACSKKKAPAPVEAPGQPDAPKQNPTYDLKLRGQREGDRTLVARTRTGTTNQNVGGKESDRKLDYGYEFTEVVLQTTPGSRKPTKLTRHYTKAWTIPNDGVGALLTRAYAGKTVSIEKGGTPDAGYTYRTDGADLSAGDRDEFHREFDKPERDDIGVLLPAKPVAVGETWTPDVSRTVRAVYGPLPFPVDVEKSKVTATLKRIELKNKQTWAAVEVKVAIYYAGWPDPSERLLAAPQLAEVTIHAVVGGTADEGTTTVKTAGDITIVNPAGAVLLRVVSDSTENEVRTPQR